jgi:hypothetical protein
MWVKGRVYFFPEIHSSYREVFHSMHFGTTIMTLIFQLNAHMQMNICIVY